MVECGCKGIRFCAVCEGSERVRGLAFKDKGKESDPRAWKERLAGFALLRFCAACQAPFVDPSLHLGALEKLTELQSHAFHAAHSESPFDPTPGPPYHGTAGGKRGLIGWKWRACCCWRTS